MGWLKALTSVSWWPYALAGILTVSGGLFGYGYMKGHASAEKKTLKAVNSALSDQLDRMETKHAKDVKIQIQAAKDELEIEHAIQDLSFPEIDSHCREPLNDWMRAFNDGVRAAATSRPESD